MTPDEIRDLMAYLEGRVRLADEATRQIVFDPPDEAGMLAAGLHPDGVRQVLGAPWWPEMVGEVVETPEFCDAAEPPAQVLRYARDVVREYIRKRFKP